MSRKNAKTERDAKSAWTASNPKGVSETTLLERIERLERAVEGSGDGLWVVEFRSTEPSWHPDNETWFSERFRKLLGYSGEHRDEFPDRMESWMAAIHPEDVDNIKTHAKKLVERGIPFDVEYRMRRRDGAYRWFSTAGNLIRDEHGKGTGAAGSIRDITDKKNGERAVRESEERFRVLHEASFGGIGIHERGKILMANRALSEMTGFSVDELIGMDGLELIAPDWRDEALKKIVTGYEAPYEAVGLRKDGTRYPLEIRGKAVPYEGRIVRSTEFRDLTERKKLEKQLHQAQKMESLGRLAGGVAHDFNNMLTPILGTAELLLLRSEKDDPRRRDYHQLLLAAQRAKEITGQLLALARRQILELQVLDVASLVIDFESLMRSTLREDIVLDIQIDCRKCHVKTDRAQFEQILLNLVLNAQDAMPKGGRIRIGVRSVVLDHERASAKDVSHAGPHVEIEIRDTGLGMDEETIQQVFEPFFTTRQEGTGLGLSTVYGIVKQHGGHIEAKSHLGRGTVFRVWLPLIDPHAGVAPAAEAASGPLTGRTATVLLVEDEEIVRSITHSMLEHYGHRVLSARDGFDALAVLEKHLDEIEILLTDVVMPQMDGAELAERFAELKPATPILFMSGYTQDALTSRRAMEPGIQIIHKPFSVEALARAIDHALKEQPSSRLS